MAHGQCTAHLFINENNTKAPFYVPNESNHPSRGVCTHGECFLSSWPSAEMLPLASSHHRSPQPDFPMM